MKNLFRKTRVVHVPEEQSFEVHIKKGFFSPWAYECHYRYYVGDKKPSSLYEPHDTEEKAEAFAIKRAAKLANKTIIWESKYANDE